MIPSASGWLVTCIMKPSKVLWNTWFHPNTHRLHISLLGYTASIWGYKQFFYLGQKPKWQPGSLSLSLFLGRAITDTLNIGPAKGSWLLISLGSQIVSLKPSMRNDLDATDRARGLQTTVILNLSPHCPLSQYLQNLRMQVSPFSNDY